MKATELVSTRKVGPVGREENDLLIKFCILPPNTGHLKYLPIHPKHRAYNTPVNWLHLLSRQ
jgi:hypothetical protein